MGDCKLGQGMPKICIPILEETQEEIWKVAERLHDSVADMIEWRADGYRDLQDPIRLRETAQGLAERIGHRELIFTVRTVWEGGEARLPFAAYAAVLKQAAAWKEVSYVDVEMFSGVRDRKQADWKNADGEYFRGVRELTAKLRQQAAVIGSYHDFDRTPPAGEITARLAVMHEIGADVPKLAAMPQSPEDVLRLMAETWQAKQTLGSVPLITMSMGSMGAVSRVAGESFGSAVTFGSAGKASAPGQIEADRLKKILKTLHAQ